MKTLKKITFSVLALSAMAVNAQNVSLTKGGAAKYEVVKGSEPVTFSVDGNRYIFSEYFKSAIMNYNLYSYNPDGALNTYANLEYDMGVFNNSYGIDDLVQLGNKVYATVEHMDKKAGKMTLSVREVSKTGTVATDETEVMTYPFEKTMNSGYNYSATSPNKNVLAVVGEYPFSKESPCKMKIATYGKDLSKMKEAEITLPGEDTKNKNIQIAVGDNGTVYIVKRTMNKNGEWILAVYQWNQGASDVKEYTLDMEAPMFITSYVFDVNPGSEIVVSGTYYQRRTVSAGEKEAVGAFYFTNKGASTKVMKSFAFDKPIENLVAKKVLINGNTAFLCAEQFKEVRETPPPGAPLGAESDYTYTHKNDYVIGIDNEGNKKFQLELAKEFTARNLNQQLQSGYFLTNGKLTVVYNDQGRKYGLSESYVPVLVQITNDGLMQSPVVFKDKVKMEYGYTLYPAHSVKDNENQISFLMGNGSEMKLLTVKMD